MRDLMHDITDTQILTVDDGDTITAGGRQWQVHITPGHALGHVSLFDL